MAAGLPLAPGVEMGEMLRSSGSTSSGSTTPAAMAAAAEARATFASDSIEKVLEALETIMEHLDLI